MSRKTLALITKKRRNFEHEQMEESPMHKDRGSTRETVCAGALEGGLVDPKLGGAVVPMLRRNAIASGSAAGW